MADQEEGAPRGVLLPPGVELPPFLVQVGEGEGRERGEEGKGGAAAPPCPIQTRGGGGTRPALAAPPLLHFGPMWPINPPRGFGNPPVLRYISNNPRNYSVSEYSRPIYQSSCLDHFETPRYVRDHIRDSELPSVHQNI